MIDFDFFKTLEKEGKIKMIIFDCNCEESPDCNCNDPGNPLNKDD